MQLNGASAAANVVEGSFIGTNTSGNASLPNGYGLQIINASNNTIGGTANGQGNTIGFNTSFGVAVLSGIGNSIRQNDYPNVPAATPASDISLAPGANNGIPAPSLISAATVSSNQVLLRFVASSSPLTFEVYLNTTSGRTFEGFANVPANDTQVTVTTAGSLSNGSEVVATATDAGHDTSAFSNSVAIASPLVVTNTNDSGSGSLRAAIINANASPDSSISFQIVPFSNSYVIMLVTPLPAITVQTIIDATGQLDGSGQPNTTGHPLVEIVGTNIGGAADGLVLASGSDGSTIEGLDFAGFAGAGIHVHSSNNLIEGDFLGTDTTGTAAGPGNTQGVWIDTGTGNTIGGTTAANTIGFNNTGILVNSASNHVLGNFVGTNSAATINLANAIGISVTGANNTIGGSVADVIGFNSTAGVSLSGNNNVVVGELIGTSSGGNKAGNAVGILISGTGNTVGGTTAGDGDTIGASGSSGISISGQNNLVVGDFIGTNAAQVINLNNVIGVLITGPNNTIGGTTAAAADHIAFNATAGVQLNGAGATANVVQGSFIGIDSSGDNLGNGIGIQITGSSSNTIGGSASAANTIGFSSTFGVSIGSGSGNLIQGNKYGYLPSRCCSRRSRSASRPTTASSCLHGSGRRTTTGSQTGMRSRSASSGQAASSRPRRSSSASPSARSPRRTS